MKEYIVTDKWLKEEENYLNKCIELYSEFIQYEYGDTDEELKIIRDEILEEPDKNCGLLYTTYDSDDEEEVELQIEISFGLRKVSYFSNYDLVYEEEYTKKEFIEFLENLDFQELYSMAGDYIEKYKEN